MTCRRRPLGSTASARAMAFAIDDDASGIDLNAPAPDAKSDYAACVRRRAETTSMLTWHALSLLLARRAHRWLRWQKQRWRVQRRARDELRRRLGCVCVVCFRSSPPDRPIRRRQHRGEQQRSAVVDALAGPHGKAVGDGARVSSAGLLFVTRHFDSFL